MLPAGSSSSGPAPRGGEKSQMNSGVSADSSYLSVILAIVQRGPLSPAAKANAIPIPPPRPITTPSPLTGEGWGEGEMPKRDWRPLTHRTCVLTMRRVPITLGRQAKDFQKWSGTKAEQNGAVSRKIEVPPRTNLPGLATNQASQNRPQLPRTVPYPPHIRSSSVPHLSHHSCLRPTFARRLHTDGNVATLPPDFAQRLHRRTHIA